LGKHDCVTLNNKIFLFPSNSRIGCLGLFLLLSIVSVILFFSFFIGLILLGCIALYYIYIKFLKKYFKKNKTKNEEKKYTEAEYIEIKKDEDNSH
jgi:Ca2+/Na+ antiporter